MKALRSFETSGTTASATRRHIPEDGNLQKRRCEEDMFCKLLATLVGHGPASQPTSQPFRHTHKQPPPLVT